MQIGRVEGCTRVLGQSQGYLGLPIRDEFVNDKVTGENTPVMISAWIPTPKELEAMLRGAPVYVQLVGRRHPPIMVTVGESPESLHGDGTLEPVVTGK